MTQKSRSQSAVETFEQSSSHSRIRHSRPLGLPAGWSPAGPLDARGVLTLQRLAGNRATSSLLTSTHSPVRDVVGRGGGSPLSPSLRSTMESHLGQDLSSVKVHTDGHSAESVGAKAYTVGEDIVVHPGQVNLGSPSGDEVLAHEAVHVVQQRSGPVSGTPIAGGIQVSDPSDSFEREAEAKTAAVIAPDRSTDATTDIPGPSVAAPVSRDHAGTNGVASVQRRKASETGSDQDGEAGGNRGFFGKVGGWFKSAKGKLKNLTGKARPVTAPMKDSPALASMSVEEQQEHARLSAGSLEGGSPDFEDESIAGAAPDRWQVTLAVSQEEVGWMKDIKAVRAAALRPPWSMDEQKLVEKVLRKRGQLAGDEKQQNELVQRFTKRMKNVGHVWVRISSYVGSKLQRLFSYGMYPQKLWDPQNQTTVGGYGGFTEPGAGQIRHPDTRHEDDPAKVYRDYVVTAQQHDAALLRASELYKSPPPYVLMGYNCSAFAKEILGAAGQSYPGKPLLPGVAYTPASLYWAIMEEWARGDKSTHTGDVHGEQVAAVGKEEDRRVDKMREESTMALSGVSPQSDRQPFVLAAGSKLKCSKTHTGPQEEVDIERDTLIELICDDEWADTHELAPIKLKGVIFYCDRPSLVNAIKKVQKESDKLARFDHETRQILHNTQEIQMVIDFGRAAKEDFLTLDSSARIELAALMNIELEELERMIELLEG